MLKYDKSLKEIWEWRNKLADQNKILTNEEYLKKLKNKTDKILKDHNIKLEKVKNHELV